MSAEKNLPSEGREFERGFGWKLLFSAAAHVLVLGGLLLIPGYTLRPVPKLMSYADVDLIDASKLGGTNLVQGSKGKAAAPPKVEPAKVKAAVPPAEEVKAEPPPPEPPPAVKEEIPPPPKEQAKPPEPAKAEPQPDEKALAMEKKVEPTPTQVQVAKAIVPTVAKEEPPTALPQAEATKPKPTLAQAQATAQPQAVQAKATATQAKAVAQAKTTATPAQAAKAQVTATKGAAQEVAKAQGSPPAKAPGSPAKAGASPAAAKTTPGADPAARDDRIAAAIKRIEEKAGTQPVGPQAGARGGGTGAGSGDTPGGPISIGPGEGVGGEIRGIAFIMYTNRLEALIKDKWVWAGQDQSLKADIGFNIMANGEVVNVRTVASSGDANYDRRAETAVRAAAPFPPPPSDYQTEFETNGFVYTFEPN